jgi:glycosyltransferase involved in cell wall biosynthesis
MTAPLAIAHVIQSLSRTGAGVTELVRKMARHQAQPPDRVLVYCIAEAADADNAAAWLPLEPVRCRPFGPLWLRYSPTLAAVVSTSGASILHAHGLWSLFSLSVLRAASRGGIPCVLSAHGMLDPGSLRHKAWKKRIAWLLWERRLARAAAVLHATSDAEAKSLRAQGLTQPVAVVPPGVDPPPRGRSPRDATAPRTALFLSRIHPIKGLLNLVDAWAAVRPSGWRCVVAGPDPVGHARLVQEAVRKAGLHDVFTFPGAVDDRGKWDLLAQVDLLLLPTFSENFGIVVAEALAAGLPVITTKAAPWSELVSHRCGWWVDVGAEPFAAALREACARSDAERLDMGDRGRRLVESRYTWPAAASHMRTVYEWIRSGGPPPSCVRLT